MGASTMATRREFERHWRAYAVAGISPSKMTGAARFLRPMIDYLQSLPAIRVLDVGCGDGVHAAYLGNDQEGDLDYWGVDLSVQALQTATRHSGCPEPFGFAAADALQLPFKSQSFDAVFAYGVLAYTANPQKALAEMVRVCRVGGLVGFWILPEPDGPSGAVFRLARWLCRNIGRLPAKGLINLGVLAMGILPVKSGVNLKNSTWRQCAEVLEVSLLPRTLGLFKQEQIMAWVAGLGLIVEYTDPTKPILVWTKVP